ncbi:MAG: hypothetical protein JO256_06150 [Alphaproteobacteria bacterium]|nr:hypothetical protein [Alphaproteobacteria bacterium]
MIRALNLFCVALMGLAILGLYHISEKTRVARMELSKTRAEIGAQKGAIAVLETEWQHVANAERVQLLAMAHGINDAASAQLSSFEQMPRRADEAPLNGSPVHNINVEIPAPAGTQQ